MRVVHRAYTRRDGTQVKASSYNIEEDECPVIAPAKNIPYRPKVHINWRLKDLPTDRCRKALLACKENYLAAARALRELSIFTTDPATRILAASDSKFLFKLNREYGNV
jgi:hypothetical protein